MLKRIASLAPLLAILCLCVQSLTLLGRLKRANEREVKMMDTLDRAVTVAQVSGALRDAAIADRDAAMAMADRALAGWRASQDRTDEAIAGWKAAMDSR